jgi:SAM-dependent methyltransferase
MTFPSNGTVHGAELAELDRKFHGYDRIRQIERLSIRRFMEAHRDKLRGRVLDFGAGTQPYGDLVDGEYVPLEKGEAWPDGPFDAVMCNQVLQYVAFPSTALERFFRELKPGGFLVLTYPCCWDEVEPTDLWRFTKVAMSHLVRAECFELLEHERRAEVAIGNFKFPLGYGLVARK